MNAVLIDIKNLSIGYKGKAFINNINLQLKKGEVLSLLGANGIGKSTLLKTITGEIGAIKGNITINSKHISDFSQKELSKIIAIVTTERVFAGGLRVSELVALGRHPHTGFFGKLSEKDIEIINNAISVVGITHKKDSFVAELSDGERQKTMIARAIAQQTPIIILDEPFSFLDTASRIEIFNLLKQISKERQTGILLSSHDVSQAIRMSDKICLVTSNREIHIGTPSEIIDNNYISTLFDNNKIIFDKSQSDFISKD